MSPPNARGARPPKGTRATRLPGTAWPPVRSQVLPQWSTAFSAPIPVKARTSSSAHFASFGFSLVSTVPR